MIPVPMEVQDLLNCWLDLHSRLSETGANTEKITITLDMVAVGLRVWGVEPRDHLPEPDEPRPLYMSVAGAETCLAW